MSTESNNSKTGEIIIGIVGFLLASPFIYMYWRRELAGSNGGLFYKPPKFSELIQDKDIHCGGISSFKFTRDKKFHISLNYNESIFVVSGDYIMESEDVGGISKIKIVPKSASRDGVERNYDLQDGSITIDYSDKVNAKFSFNGEKFSCGI